MIKDPKRRDSTGAIILSCLFLVGISGHLAVPTRPLMLLLTPVILFACGAFVLGRAIHDGGLRIAVWGASTYAATFLLEVWGVATGKIFGAYFYGPVLGPKLLGVPLVIGFNWVLVVLGAATLAGKLTRSAIVASLYAAGAAVLFDLVLEPVAVSLGYWSWPPQGGPSVQLPVTTAASVTGLLSTAKAPASSGVSVATAVPIANFAAWFFIAFTAALFYQVQRVESRTRLPKIYLGIQFVFFSVMLAGVAIR